MPHTCSQNRALDLPGYFSKEPFKFYYDEYTDTTDTSAAGNAYDHMTKVFDAYSGRTK